MKDFFKILVSVLAIMFLEYDERRKYFTSISSKWDAFMVNYSFNSVKYIARPLHYDAITLLLKGTDANTSAAVNKRRIIMRSVWYYDDRICDVMLAAYYDYFMPNQSIYGRPHIPENRQMEFITKYTYYIKHIKNPSDEIIEYDKFINHL